MFADVDLFPQVILVRAPSVPKYGTASPLMVAGTLLNSSTLPDQEGTVGQIVKEDRLGRIFKVIGNLA